MGWCVQMINLKVRNMGKIVIINLTANKVTAYKQVDTGCVKKLMRVHDWGVCAPLKVYTCIGEIQTFVNALGYTDFRKHS